MMKKFALLLFSIAAALHVAAGQQHSTQGQQRAVRQDGITFEVEELSKPEKLLPKKSLADIYRGFVDEHGGENHLEDARYVSGDTSPLPDSLRRPIRIVCGSEMPDYLVSPGYHSFFDGMYMAYSDHRPFVLSPDMIWLLVSQGFARHVNANPEAMRHHFVDFADRMSLVVFTSEDISLSSTADEWETVFSQFIDLMAQNTKGDIIEILSADFSTTTPVERIASQITVMDAMEPYFEFISMFVGCGIPEITLQGTPEDWQKVLEKTQRLADYDLKWWISELTPLLRQFVKASQGDVDKKFWSEMFKCHVMKSKRGSRMIYPPDVIDGWIVKFFPYDKDGNRNDLVSVNKRAITGHNLPDEIVKVDLKYIHAPQGTEPVTTMLELWAGFIGLEQDDTTFALTPRIGWFISRKDEANDKLRQRFEADNMRGGISLKVKEVPSALLELPHIKQLELRFIDSIVIPDKMKNVRIDKLSLHGKISEQEKDRIRAMFPETQLYIN